MIVLDLPFPPSANRLTRHGVSKSRKLMSYPNPDYTAWIREADGMYQLQRRNAGRPIKGFFTYHIALDETRWPKASDGENRMKAVADFLQRVGLIENDKYATGGSWAWGPVKGARVTVHPVQHARIKVAA